MDLFLVYTTIVMSLYLFINSNLNLGQGGRRGGFIEKGRGKKMKFRSLAASTCGDFYHKVLKSTNTCSVVSYDHESYGRWQLIGSWGSGTSTHVSVYSTQIDYQVSYFSGTSLFSSSYSSCVVLEQVPLCSCTMSWSTLSAEQRTSRRKPGSVQNAMKQNL